MYVCVYLSLSLSLSLSLYIYIYTYEVPADVPDNTTAYVLFTSGSTGKPKGCMVLYIYIYIHTYIHTYIRIHVNLSLSIYLYIYIYTHTYVGAAQGILQVRQGGGQELRPHRGLSSSSVG